MSSTGDLGCNVHWLHTHASEHIYFKMISKCKGSQMLKLVTLEIEEEVVEAWHGVDACVPACICVQVPHYCKEIYETNNRKRRSFRETYYNNGFLLFKCAYACLSEFLLSSLLKQHIERACIAVCCGYDSIPANLTACVGYLTQNMGTLH